MPSTTIRPVKRSDWQQWLPLWEGYNTFYQRVAAQDVTEATWNRFFDHYEPVHAFVAKRDDGQLAGLVHYIFHRNTFMVGPVTYLQDLFTSIEVRGQGIGRALIQAVYEEAARVGSPRVYWHTHESNAQARVLYDKVAERSGFIQYRKAL